MAKQERNREDAWTTAFRVGETFAARHEDDEVETVPVTTLLYVAEHHERVVTPVREVNESHTAT